MTAKTLLGPDGQPIKKRDLTGEWAAPTFGGVRSPIAGHPAEGLTPVRLAALHRAAAQGDSLAYFELAEDIEERDLHYLAVLSTRKRQISQLPITVEAASDDPNHIKHADFLRDWIKSGALGSALFDFYDAIGKGFSVYEIEWHATPELVIPELIYRPQRFFTFDRNDGDTLLMRDMAGDIPLTPHKFLVHRHPAKSGLIVRSGLARMVSWMWMYKAFTIKDWAIFVQNYGMPIRVGRYGQSATEEDKRILWNAVANVAGDCAAIFPDSMNIEFIHLQQNSGQQEIYERRADWCDRQISKAVLGQTTTTDAISGGHAVSQEHRKVQEDIEKADAGLGSDTLTKYLIPYMIAFQFGPQVDYPRINIGRKDEVPLKEVIEALSKVPGAQVEKSQFLDRLGFSEAGTDSELVGLPLNLRAEPVPDSGSVPVFSRSFSREKQPDFVERLSERLAQDAAGAMAGLIDPIREIFETSKTLQEAASRLSKLNLDEKTFSQAMARGMALAELSGRAAILDEIEHG